jgi:hypothetical protein
LYPAEIDTVIGISAANVRVEVPRPEQSDRSRRSEMLRRIRGAIKSAFARDAWSGKPSPIRPRGGSQAAKGAPELKQGEDTGVTMKRQLTARNNAWKTTAAANRSTENRLAVRVAVTLAA